MKFENSPFNVPKIFQGKENNQLNLETCFKKKQDLNQAMKKMLNDTSLVKKNFKLYMITQRKVLEFEINATGVSTIKNMLNFFLKLGKKYGVQNHICKVIFDEKEICSSTFIKIYNYYESPLRKRSSKSENDSLTMEFYKTF